MAGIAPHNSAGIPGPSAVGRPGPAGRCVPFCGRVGGYSRWPTTREGGELALRHGRRAKGGEQGCLRDSGACAGSGLPAPMPAVRAMGRRGEASRRASEGHGLPHHARHAAHGERRRRSGEPSGSSGTAGPSAPLPPCGPMGAERGGGGVWRAFRGLPERRGPQRRCRRAVPWGGEGRQKSGEPSRPSERCRPQRHARRAVP